MSNLPFRLAVEVPPPPGGYPVMDPCKGFCCGPDEPGKSSNGAFPTPRSPLCGKVRSPNTLARNIISRAYEYTV